MNDLALQSKVAKLLLTPEFVGYDKRDLEAFVIYHTENPWIWSEFVRFAKELLPVAQRKSKKFGAKLIMERVRYEHEVEDRRGEFLINNNYTALYARALTSKYPIFQNFFEFREPKGLKAAA